MPPQTQTSSHQLAATFDAWFKLFPNAEPHLGTLNDIDAIISSTNLQPNNKIWDFGCGTGRHLRELHLRNYHNIRGIDISQTAINTANQTQTTPSIRYIHSDFRNYLSSTTDTADLIYSLDFTFSLFPPDEFTALLSNCIQRLNRHCHIYIEMWDTQAVIQKHELDTNHTITLPTGQFIYQGQYDLDSQTLQFKHSFTPNNQPTQHLPIQTHYLYTDQDIQTIIAPLNLKLIESYQPTASFSRHFVFTNE